MVSHPRYETGSLVLRPAAAVVSGGHLIPVDAGRTSGGGRRTGGGGRHTSGGGRRTSESGIDSRASGIIVSLRDVGRVRHP